MYARSLLAASALVAGAAAQFATFSDSGVEYRVNIPSSTSSTKSGTIYIQMLAPSGTTWLGLGQGTQMAGANMFLLYADGQGNVTVSPRLGTGEVQPNFNSDAQITVLEGSGITASGQLVANIRCDTCITWSGGSFDPTSSSSDWIWSIKSGDPLDSTDTSANLQQHDTESTFSLDLTSATGGSSSNPFVSTSSSGGTSSAGTSSASGTAAATGTSGSSPSSTSGVTAPLPSTSGSSSSSSGSFSIPINPTRATHAGVMSVVFLLFFPSFALTLYLPWAKRVRFVHAPLQIFSIILLLVGLGTGVKLGKSIEMLDGYHQIIGYAVIVVMVGFQPALGIYQHMYYHKTGGRSALGVFHQWLGRTVIMAGIVNGGLGFMQSGAVGSTNVPRYAVVLYSIVAVVMLCVYVTIVMFSAFRARRNVGAEEKLVGNVGYEMHPSSGPDYEPRNQYQPNTRGYESSYQSSQQQNYGRGQTYR